MANYRSILFDPKTGKTICKFPDLPGGVRNYPGTAASAVLPIKLNTCKKGKNSPVEVAICGGAPEEAYQRAEAKLPLLPAWLTCGKIKITDTEVKRNIETMPTPRIMADMLILRTEHIS
ncbi:hypothetical protein IFM89_025875 [Coptis chinensis]|uniref:Glyoxal oxidase N-terminal domain-containing protein n=1 Tax=Coptis chinensis TaxID=261450 RepID=A0A835H0L6_9MAGN|nr:hypothetical protein IFM89_025875 [Coptis chinensis]